MNIEEGSEPNATTQHHLMYWPEDSTSLFPSFLNDPYCASAEINEYQWWTDEAQGHQPRPVDKPTTTNIIPTGNLAVNHPQLSRKRKQPPNLIVQKSFQIHQPETDISTDENESNGDNEQEEEVNWKPIPGGEKAQAKSNGRNSSNISNKEVRWADQLLNSCAAAIEAAHLQRVQHLLCVLHQLASPSGDANHRLASHGLRALTHRLSTSGGYRIGMNKGGILFPTFASTEPRLFRSALIKFHEVSPWFAFPNSIANASILQTLPSDSSRNLHIIDVGVSHGIQWPTLLEALTHRPGGPPALVRLTVTAGTNAPASFSTAPQGYDFPSHLLRYAKSIHLNLKIDEIQTLNPQALSNAAAPHNDETLVVCAQFRLHQLGHDGPDDERTEFMKSIRDLGPDLVVLSEVDCECCCGRCGGSGGGGGGGGFARRVEFLWRFLDSTSAAFKERDSGERRVVEGEAARVLEAGMMVGEKRERWDERMLGLGFREKRFGEEALDGVRALLRKYDSNWEMRAVEEDDEGEGGVTCLRLCWKGQPVSFCSLWKVSPTKEQGDDQT